MTALAVATAGLLSACAGAAAEPAPTALPVAAIEAGVIAEGKVMPAAFVELRFTDSGTVAELLVAEGDQVRAGDALARLDARELALRLRQAEAAYEQATASYEDLRAGATPEQVAAAEARVSQAQAGVAQAEGSVTPADVAAARAQLDQARAHLDRLLAGPEGTDVTRAQADADEARANLQSQRDALSLAKTSAGRAAEQAANRLRDAQDAYSTLYWDNREKDRLPGDLPQALLDAEAAALRAVKDAELGLAQAQAAYEQAARAESEGVAAAEARLASAQAGLEQVASGAEADEVAAARAQVAQAQAGLDKLRGQSRQGSLDAAQAAAVAASAELSALTAGPKESALAVARARVHAAEADRDLARLMLDQATLVAPIAGAVAELNLKVGEVTPSEAPALVLADMGAWQIETEDLTELSVVQVREGAAAEIRFDALDGLTLPGVVAQVKPIGKNRQGDIVYTVVVKPGAWDSRLRWNMTASVKLGG